MYQISKEITVGDLVIVYWEDTEEHRSWTDIRLIDEIDVPPAKHVGWFHSIDDGQIRIVQSVAGRETAEGSGIGLDVGPCVIPIGSIVTVEKIRDDEFDVIIPDDKERNQNG